MDEVNLECRERTRLPRPRSSQEDIGFYSREQYEGSESSSEGTWSTDAVFRSTMGLHVGQQGGGDMRN